MLQENSNVIFHNLYIFLVDYLYDITAIVLILGDVPVWKIKIMVVM